MSARLPLSVIVPCGPRLDHLDRCVHSLRAQQLDEPHEMLFVDAAPGRDRGAAFARFEDIRVVTAPTALAPGPARNLGAEHARGRVLAFLDADCVAEPGWIAGALAALDGDVLLAGGPVLHALPNHPIAPIDNVLQFAEQGPRRPAGPAAYFPACNLSIRRETFAEVGGFPTAFPIGEDVAFSHAVAALRPHALGFEPRMRIRHFGRTTLSGLWSHQRDFGKVRATTGFFLDERARRLGRSPLAMPLVGAKRLAFIAKRTAHWDPGGLLRLGILFPVLAFGLTAWAWGFRQGCVAPRSPTR